jgi:hypothetical protein
MGMSVVMYGAIISSNSSILISQLLSFKGILMERDFIDPFFSTIVELAICKIREIDGLVLYCTIEQDVFRPGEEIQCSLSLAPPIWCYISANKIKFQVTIFETLKYTKLIYWIFCIYHAL